MIKAIVTRHQSGKLEEFIISGHAGSGEYGFDIVCAAVSTLSINVINSLETLTDCQADIDLDDLNGGYLRIALPSDHYLTDASVQLLLESFLLGLQNLAQNASEFVNLQIITKE